MCTSAFWFLVVHLLLQLTGVRLVDSKIAGKMENDIKTGNVFIEFSPLVSTLDQFNHSRYTVNELMSLISKVTTRFTKMYLEMDYDQYEENNLPTELFAIAKYNCLQSTTQKVEVALGFCMSGCTCKETFHLASLAKKFADKANSKCMGTVSTLFLNLFINRSGSCNLENCTSVEYLLNGYQWGSLMTFFELCDARVYLYKFANQSAPVSLEYKSVADFFLPKETTDCRHYGENLHIKWKKISFIDDGNKGLVNMTNLVNSWRNALNDSNYEYILSQAFDTVNLHSSGKWKTNGWWYLSADPGTTNTVDFIFEEKIKQAKQVDREEDPRNFKWLYGAWKFRKNSTGIIGGGIVPYEKITRDFCQIMIFGTNLVSFLTNSNNTHFSTCGSDARLVIVLKKASSEFNNSLQFFDGMKILVLVSFDFNQQERIDLVENLKELKIPYGYHYSMDECNRVGPYSAQEIRVKDAILCDTESVAYVFTYNEQTHNQNLRATGLFRRRLVLFESCKTLVKLSRKKYAEIGFVMENFHKVDNFYKSPIEMQNFVRYVDLLIKWVNKQKNTIIFVGPEIDSTDASWYVRNWYIDSYITTTAKDETLKLSQLNYQMINYTSDQSDDFRLNVYSSVKSVIIPLSAVLALVTFTFFSAICLMRKYYKRNTFTKDDISKFLYGLKTEDDSLEMGWSIPYDKSRFEIPRDRFQIETDKILGSGEFGKINRGKLESLNGSVYVAVKTTNPQKFHRMAVNGLLSEIKILAYIGKHANIIELIGANTENLRDGKVYIILELCHMGSLQKYLRDINLLVKVPRRNEENILNLESKYVNTETNGKVVDVGLSIDLYKCSIEICSGMEYLAEKHVVHADLATRNILLNLRREAKICDFGLSHRLYNYATYVKSHQEPFPWKWMAPEALRLMQFSEKTDVWSYGVTLWEIYSFGSTPYAGLAWDVNFVGMLESGLKLSKPEFDDNDMYEIMQKCWRVLPDERPRFCQLLSQLNSWNDRKLENN